MTIHRLLDRSTDAARTGCVLEPHLARESSVCVVRGGPCAGVYYEAEPGLFKHEAGGFATLSVDSATGEAVLRMGEDYVAKNAGLAEVGWQGASLVLQTKGRALTHSICVVCQCILRNDEASRTPGASRLCFHQGAYHATYADCTALCAFRTEKLGAQHWSCCGDLEASNRTCRAAKHVSDAQLAVSCFFSASKGGRAYSAHNANNEPLYEGGASNSQATLGLVTVVLDSGATHALVVWEHRFRVMCRLL